MSRRMALVGCAVLLLASGCGARVERETGGPAAVSAPSNPEPPPVARTGDSVQALPAGSPSPTAPDVAASNQIPASWGAKPGGPARSDSARSTNGAPVAASQAPVGAKAPEKVHEAGPDPSAAPVRPPSASATRTPVAVATVGTLSGPAGTVLGGTADGVKVWARLVNDNGGLGGHPVKLTVVDDGGDPARHKAAVQEQIESQKVVAFIGNPEAITGASSVGYITAKGVPVVGSDTAASWFYSSPMYFPQAGSGDILAFTGTPRWAARALPEGQRKFGWISCVEAKVCDDADRVWAKHSAEYGFEVVYRGRTSLAQPDFTAECLAARNAGVQVLAIALDQNSVLRVAASCARQGFRPTYATGALIISPQLATDQNLDGILGETNVFPYFQTDTPATAEFAKAMRTYAPNLKYGEGAATGWVAAKLFERAARNLSEPPTSAAILRGLWGIKDDTLGGLTQPLTFVQNQVAPRKETCAFDITVRDRAWVSTDNFRLHCFPLPKDLT